MDKKVQFHGSDLEKIEEYYHIPKESIVRFGANVNPLGLSKSVKEDVASHLDLISSYPDREYRSLKECIAQYCGTNQEYIAVGNGSTELISLFINQCAPKKALVLGPTYSEYERELSFTGGSIFHYNLAESTDFQLDTDDFIEHLTSDIQLVIICNPNNPTSSAINKTDMKHILTECKERQISVMIDETYVEFAPDIEQITAVSLVPDFDNLMIIRGVSKFFAAPGLRFGYCITSNQSFLQSLKTHQNPWSLNSIGAYAGEKMLLDADYIQQTRELILTQRSYMETELKKLDAFKIYPAYGNFILVRILKEGITSFDVFDAAIKQHMMIRDCSSFAELDGEYVRFCIMNPADNQRLLEVFKQL